ncbi:DUF4440 domain-containing protein [Microcoleus sp. Pol1B3]|uniref:DUF4440 domain-containing protein n=1 Tax=unclassified Microcoleus TaxID=2642155 RepID=UPI002FCF1305
MEISSEDRDTLECLEQELWREETRVNTERMNELIAQDFFEFGRSGRVWQRQDTLVAEPSSRDVLRPLPEFHIRLLDENIAQVTYDSAFIYDGVVEHTHRSSIWSRTASGWVVRFHQGTPFQP